MSETLVPAGALKNKAMNNIKKYNCFALYGIELSLLIWIENTLAFFENKNYPLKSISYDINRSKLGRKNIATFLKDFDHHYESLSLTLFYGKNLKKPSTWQYGVSYDTISKSLVLFAQSKIENDEELQLLFHQYLSEILQNTISHSGYSYYQEDYYDYYLGGTESMNLYKEDSLYFWNTFKPQNIDTFLNCKNVLRHIYKENILNKEHLKNYIDGIELALWVSKNNLGSLKPFGSENYLWVIPNEKIDFVAKKFLEHHLLVGVSENSALIW